MESTFTINTQSGYIELNLFNQFDIYLSFGFIAFMTALVIGLRVRKVLRDRRKQARTAPSVFMDPDSPFADPVWN